MISAWNRPTLPKRGDENQFFLFELVGRFMSQWVHVEYNLSLLRSALVGEHLNGEAARKYGLDRQFKDRLSELEKEAERRFVRTPNQELEGEFSTIRQAVEGFSARRNEVAHAVVQPSIFLESFIEDRTLGRNAWCLAPPHYERRHFSDGGPTFAYTSRELVSFIVEMDHLNKQIERLGRMLAP